MVSYIWVGCPSQSPRIKQKDFHLCAFAPQLAAVHLVDSHYCTDPGKFISVLCTSLSTMLHVELPHVNVLSKMDLIEQYGKLGMAPFREGDVESGGVRCRSAAMVQGCFAGSWLGKWCKSHWVLGSRESPTSTTGFQRLSVFPHSFQPGLLHGGLGPLLPG